MDNAHRLDIGMHPLNFAAGYRVLTFVLLLMPSGYSYSQPFLEDGSSDETKTFTQPPTQMLRSLYLDNKGLPSHERFLRFHGLYPTQLREQQEAYFSVTFERAAAVEEGGFLLPKQTAVLLNIDFYVEAIRTYNSINTAPPIWDGRVYEDAGKLIVGGYSSKYNERPVGQINTAGTFTPIFVDNYVGEFPILRVLPEQVLYDPFTAQLLKLVPRNGERTEERTKRFLPLNIYGKHGKSLDDIKYRLENAKKNSALSLFAIKGGNIFPVASCQIASSTVVKTIDGYRPELTEGCTQPGNGSVITLTLKGRFADCLTIDGSEIFVSADNLAKHSLPFSKDGFVEAGGMTIDGFFDEWRNLRGINDHEGDFVQYLFKNPDTDLLEFKLTNDSKYIYFYTRVKGAHGRTGEGGRYYWYTYIDVDADASTGYPPTRDDNCYFGVPIGDDCEAQFEFIGNKFVKTFFGFTGIAAEKEVLDGRMLLGPSHYSAQGRNGVKREFYKTEYVNRRGSRFITHDYTEGTSEDIIIALSADGSEMEMRVEMKGFLKDIQGNDLMYPGRRINIAAGAESSSNHYNSNKWGADSTPVIYGYVLQ